MRYESVSATVTKPRKANVARFALSSFVRGTSHTSEWTMLSTFTNARALRNSA